ncbi:reductive dehalogenase [Dehalogenimonas sp. WBC-2]
MSTFHSTVSRRDFMKALGLSAAGLGAAAATAPVFHDLDELSTSSTASRKRPWYVKEREAHHPTVELDWDQIHRFDQRLQCQANSTNAKYAGAEEWAKIAVEATEFKKTTLGGKGNTHRDMALSGSASRGIIGTPYSGRAGVSGKDTLKTFLPPDFVKTPEQMGFPQWTGTPEEAAHMLRAAAIFYGAGQVGFAKLDQKLVFTYSKGEANSTKYIGSWPPPLSAARRIDIEDVDQGWDDGEVVHLPNKPLWEISVMIPMARDAWRTAQSDRSSGPAAAANSSRYRIMEIVQPCIQGFIKSLGYTCYGYFEGSGGIVPAQASAVLTGIAEMGRHSEAVIDPEYGANMGYYSLLTDLPLAEENPIDAGIFRFCHSCHKCANQCPSESISHDSEPSWEVTQGIGTPYKIPNINQVPGKKLFWTDMHSCMKYRTIHGCNVCRPNCTFNVNSGAMAHQVIKSTISTTPLLNDFFYKMGEVFKYGADKDPELWWDHQLPTFGFETTSTTYDGGYKR